MVGLVKLEEGEVKCPKCKGKAYTREENGFKTLCSKCMGYGKLDWIENVVGVRPGNRSGRPKYKQEYIQLVKR